MHESVQAVQAEVMMSFLVSEELSFRIPVELSYKRAIPTPYASPSTFPATPGDLGVRA